MKSGEWLIQEEIKKITGQMDIPEFSFGELEDLQVLILIISALWFLFFNRNKRGNKSRKEETRGMNVLF